MLQFWEVLKKDQPQITSNGLNGQKKAHLSLKTRLKNEKKVWVLQDLNPSLLGDNQATHPLYHSDLHIQKPPKV